MYFSGVKLISDYAKCLTKDSVDRQNLLQVVLSNRNQFPDANIFLLYCKNSKKLWEIFHKIPFQSVIYRIEKFGSHFNLSSTTMKSASLAWETNSSKTMLVEFFDELCSLFLLMALFSLCHLNNNDNNKY